MKWPWISRRAGAEQLGREIQRHNAEVLRLTTAAEARYRTVAQECSWLRERNEQLVDTIIAFKKDGFGIPSKGSIKQPKDVEAGVLERIEGGLTRDFIANATRDMVSKGIPAADAEREARRLREEAVAENPAGG